MKPVQLIYVFFLLHFGAYAQTISIPSEKQFRQHVIVRGLQDPWELTVGPDGWLWFTEAKTYKIFRINRASGKKEELADLHEFFKLPENKAKGLPSARLMGMALHPGLLKDKPFVYVAFLSASSGCKTNKGGCMATTTIARLRYNRRTQRLSSPDIVCDTIPGSNDHNGGRLLIAPIDGKPYLFYSVGDMGAGQFDNGGRPNHAQDVTSYEGKILRFRIEPQKSEWIPKDNPYSNSAVWSTGHRNPQGLAYAGRIYSSEHGPYSDDEINLIEKGGNYGHPLIIGFADGNYNGLAAGVAADSILPGYWHTTYPFIKRESANSDSMGAAFRPPLFSLYATPAAVLKKLFDDIKAGVKDAKWVSEAPSSIDVYTNNAIPGWRNSLLITTLKGGKLIRLKLNANGTKIIGDTVSYFKGNNRYRDIAISPDGKRIYLATDSTGVTSGPSKQNLQQTNCRGCIIEVSYIENRKP